MLGSYKNSVEKEKIQQNIEENEQYFIYEEIEFSD
jgi:hypothetical protein